ncbi:XRE family transcriptional regulator [Natronospirillum operosum]|uniref:XRE family transcriptional regulator n=1 Tax=Natronospirillum operosum TaxID=2759953 RepID=A0A4Z0WAT3_9GAMM|nr:helix-turn-helix transcriptional regulator [Natronospirillum operosum]TGG92841.1 XRE family transcriptional regulator [Natronospirillum operosum]
MGSAGHILSQFRRARRLSQLELSLQADVSARHISFIETGRTQPSRDVLLRLSAVMNLSHRDTNHLLTACGYAAVYSDIPLEETAMASVRQALTIMLEHHAPYPAVVLNQHWDLQMANRSMQQLISALLPAHQSDTQLNMMVVLFEPDGLRPFITNWPDVAALLLRRLKLQLQTQPSPKLAGLMNHLLSLDPPEHWQTPTPQSWEGPMLTANLNVHGQPLSIFSTLTSFGTALDAGLQELMIESYFPADDATKAFFEYLAKEVDN